MASEIFLAPTPSICESVSVDLSVNVVTIRRFRAGGQHFDLSLQNDVILVLDSNRGTWAGESGWQAWAPFSAWHIRRIRGIARAALRKAENRFGWTVIRRSASGRNESIIFVRKYSKGEIIALYKRDRPANKENWAEDLAPFTFPTKAQARRAGMQGLAAYTPEALVILGFNETSA